MNEFKRFSNDKVARVLFPVIILIFIAALIFQPDFSEYLLPIQIISIIIAAILLGLLIFWIVRKYKK